MGIQSHTAAGTGGAPSSPGAVAPQDCPVAALGRRLARLVPAYDAANADMYSHNPTVRGIAWIRANEIASRIDDVGKAVVAFRATSAEGALLQIAVAHANLQLLTGDDPDHADLLRR